jgi:hypothetical protein
MDANSPSLVVLALAVRNEIVFVFKPLCAFDTVVLSQRRKVLRILCVFILLQVFPGS